MAVVVTPVQLKIVAALKKIGTSNGTALNETTAPVALSNEDATEWHNQRNCMYDLLVAQQIASFGDKAVEAAKKKMKELFPAIESMKAGTSNAIIRGNVSCNVEVRNSSPRLDSALLVSALAKRGIDLQDVEAIIKEASKESKPPTFYKPSIVMDQG